MSVCAPVRTAAGGAPWRGVAGNAESSGQMSGSGACAQRVSAEECRCWKEEGEGEKAVRGEGCGKEKWHFFAAWLA